MRYVFKFNEINDFLVNQILEGLKFNFPLFIIKKKPQRKFSEAKFLKKKSDYFTIKVTLLASLLASSESF